MRISDWSSDVCSSDLPCSPPCAARAVCRKPPEARRERNCRASGGRKTRGRRVDRGGDGDRKSVVSGKSVSVRVDLGGRRIINKKQKHTTTKSTTRKRTQLKNRNSWVSKIKTMN